jgi:hypothetical protein
MKAFLTISFLLVLCLVPAPPSWAANKTDAKNIAIGNATSATGAAAPEAIAPAADEAPAAEEIAPTAKKAARPAIRKPKGLHVKVQGDRLSVNAKDQIFGNVIALVANSAEFDVDLTNDVFDMKLSTRFMDAMLQRGILRLISLIDQKNYFISYRPDGSIKKLEVYGDLASGQRTLTGRRQRMAPPPTPPTIVVPDRNRRKRISRPPTGEDAKEAAEEPMEEEEVLELYYKHFTPLAGREEEEAQAKPAPEPAPTPAPAPAPAPAPVLCPVGMVPAPAIDCPDPDCVPEGGPAPGTCILTAPFIGP